MTAQESNPQAGLPAPKGMAELVRLRNAKAGLILYMRMKVDLEDWHGVADAAMDLREIEAQLKYLGD